MTLSSQTICFEARCKCGVGFIHTQLASSYTNAPQQLASSRSTVGFITRDFHALISRQHSQTNRHGLYTLFLTSKSRCMQKISSVDALLTTQNVMSRSGRFGGGNTGWSQLQLASSVSPLWEKRSTGQIYMIVSPMFFGISPLSLQQSWGCISDSEVTCRLIMPFMIQMSCVSYALCFICISKMIFHFKEVPSYSLSPWTWPLLFLIGMLWTTQTAWTHNDA